MNEAPQPPVSHDAQSSATACWRWTSSQSLLVALLLILAYAPTLGNDFTLDDEVVKHGAYPRQLTEAIYLLWEPVPHGQLLHYRPVTFATFALDHALAGNRPGWYHLTNLALAILATLLAIRLLACWLPHFGALAAGLLFGLLPGHSEAIISIHNRSQMLSAIGMFATLICFCKVCAMGSSSRRWQIWGAISLWLGCLAKESALVTPLLAVLVIAWQRPARSRYPAIGLAILWQTAAGLAYLALRYQALGTLGMPGVEGFVAEAGLPTRYVNGCRALTHYLRLICFPYPLTCDYPWQPVTWHVTALVWPFVAIVMAWLLWHKSLMARTIAFGWWWLVICLTPVLHIAPLQIPFAERSLYPASLGMAIVWALLLSRLARRQWLWLAITLTFMVGIDTNRSCDWSSNGVLWRSTLATTPDSFRARIYLGAEQARSGKNLAMRGERQWATQAWQLAIGWYEAALQHRPNRLNQALIHHSLGQIRLWLGQRNQAKTSFAAVLALYPNYGPTWFVLGDVAYRAGRLEEALACYQKIPGPRNSWDQSYGPVTERIGKCRMLQQK